VLKQGSGDYATSLAAAAFGLVLAALNIFLECRVPLSRQKFV
jgi:hypothetical protein